MIGTGMTIEQRQLRRHHIYVGLCRRYGVKPEPWGCHLLWPDCIRRLRREYLLARLVHPVQNVHPVHTL